MYSKHESLTKALRIASSQAQQDGSLAEEILTRVVIESLRQYQQKLNVGVQDSFADLLDTFKQKISESIFDIGSHWKVATQREAILFPQNCRFLFQKGQMVLVVIEERPQIRSLQLDHKITNSSTRRFGLAMPYVVFVLLFRMERTPVFSTMYCGWRTAPLLSLNDTLCKPLLTNIHTNLAVCMAPYQFPDVLANVCQKSEYVVASFWHSEFNGDLSEMWDRKDEYHRCFRTAEAWELESEVNSMFVLNPTKPYHDANTVQHIIDNCTRHQEEPDETGLRHRLTAQIDNCVEDLFKKVMRYFQKGKFEKHYPKEVRDQLAAALEFASKEYTAALLALEHELQELAQDIALNSPDSYKWQKRSRYWS